VHYQPSKTSHTSWSCASTLLFNNADAEDDGPRSSQNHVYPIEKLWTWSRTASQKQGTSRTACQRVHAIHRLRKTSTRASNSNLAFCNGRKKNTNIFPARRRLTLFLYTEPSDFGRQPRVPRRSPQTLRDTVPRTRQSFALVQLRRRYTVPRQIPGTTERAINDGNSIRNLEIHGVHWNQRRRTLTWANGYTTGSRYKRLRPLIHLAEDFPNLESLAVTPLQQSHSGSQGILAEEVNLYHSAVLQYFQGYKDNGHECKIPEIIIHGRRG